jgi:hypothetical protein
MEAFVAKFEDEFSLIACLSSSMATGTWYIDSGTYFHMTRVRGYSSKLEESTSYVYITLGDDAKYKPVGYGTIKFQRESGKPLSISDIFFVPSLTKNLIFVSQLEDEGYVVTFWDGKVHIHPKCKHEKSVGCEEGQIV